MPLNLDYVFVNSVKTKIYGHESAWINLSIQEKKIE